ncbi:uncharacterized protein LOC131214458 [Anopheles bellator]|uniref:uncharacterized protein LOC131214458 n=1 Tax=Anopheles bellator TaxID=139047 RepID=UPI002648438B|nr:uncharacterized protein LOC131214458 [Anopheles bellator]
MCKLLCLFAITVVVVGMPNGPQRSAFKTIIPLARGPMKSIVKREVPALNTEKGVVGTVVEDQDDMDKSETFGFGYRNYYYGYPRYHYGYYYPAYHYGYYPYYSGYYW